MNSFMGLVKKDLLISRFWYSAWLIVLFLLMVGGSSLAKKLGEPSLVVPGIIMLVTLHLFFMPIMMYSSLRIEGKTQLWLYSPQSSMKLLLSKCTATFILQMVSQLLVIGYGLIMLKWFINRNVSEFLSVKSLILMNVGLISISFYFMVWIMFLWTVYHSLGKYPALKSFRWLVVVLVMIMYNILETLFIKLKVIKDHLFNWTTEIDVSIFMVYKQDMGWTLEYSAVPIPIMPIILYTILTIILFIAASRLLDKKVEV